MVFWVYFSRENRLDDCLAGSRQLYEQEWNNQCTAEKHENDCSNLKDIAKAVGLNKQRESQVNECYRRYSFK